MLFQRSLRERTISRIVFYTGVLLFLLLMDLSQRVSIAEERHERLMALGFTKSEAAKLSGLPDWLRIAL